MLLGSYIYIDDGFIFLRVKKIGADTFFILVMYKIWMYFFFLGLYVCFVDLLYFFLVSIFFYLFRFLEF